ncbi:hypothetical protein [Mesorhizobium sp.]|uniref:hypothetical protein n=1 Tax=Mesorhizobium sp. TaxID=1871066 RepID=UPI00257D9796|nr:hypothetical protein [Mesorhizobium sp.]
MAKKTGDGGIADMSFKMTKEFRYRFKLEALKADLTMKELLEKIFSDYIGQEPE